MAQINVPLMNTSLGNMGAANQEADKMRAKMNEVFVPQPVIRTTSRTS